MGGNKLKRFAVLFSLLFILEECKVVCIKTSSNFRSSSYDVDDVELNKDGYKDGFDGNNNNKTLMFEEEEFKSNGKYMTSSNSIYDYSKYDRELEEMSRQIYGRAKEFEVMPHEVSGRKSKRFMIGATILGLTMWASLAAVALPDCLKKTKNIKTIETLKEQVLTERSEINLDWATVDAKERYFDRLVTELELLKQSIKTMDEIKNDILMLIDTGTLKKLKADKNEIAESIKIINKFNDKLIIEDDSGISYAAVVVVHIGASVGYLIYNQIQLDRIKVAPRLPQTKVAFQQVSRFQKVKTTLKNNGRAALVGLALAALNFGLQYKLCKDALKRTNEVIAKSREALTNLTKIRDKMERFNSDIEYNYAKVWLEISGKNFTGFIENAIATAKSAEKKTPEIETAVKNMEKFNGEIKQTNSSGVMDFKKVENLSNLLIKGFLNANVQLNCMLKKIRIFRVVRDSCEKGVGTLDSLWADTTKQQKEQLTKCHKYMELNKGKLVSLIEDMIKVRGKSSICIQNNVLIKATICRDYINGKSTDDIKSKLSVAASKHISYFISKCPPAPVDDVTSDSICKFKENAKGKWKLFETFSKFHQASVENAWNQCKLSLTQKNNICSKKQGFGNLQDIITKYKNYDSAEVTQVFNTCDLTMTNQHKMLMCLANANKNQIINKFYTIYGKEKVLRYINTPGNCT